MPDGDSTKPSDVIDEDLFCMQCGYNLRGLSGDPKRCPECGFRNALADIRMPAQAISAELRRLETAPTFCFAAELAWLVAAVIVVFTFKRRFFWEISFLWIVPTLFGLVALMLGVWRFAESCQYQSGWRRLLFRFHLYAVKIFGLAYATLFCTFALPASLHSHQVGSVLAWLATLVVIIMLWVLTAIWVPRWYARVKTELEPMQRGVAVEMYRQRARRGRRG